MPIHPTPLLAAHRAATEDATDDVAVARAIVSQPKLVLADEPTANLDSKSMEKLMAHFRELNRMHKVTFLIATHDQRVMEWADRRINMEDGRVIRDELQRAI